MRRLIAFFSVFLALLAVYGEEVELRFMFWGNSMRFASIAEATELYERSHEGVDIILDEKSYGDARQSLKILSREADLPDIVAYDCKWTDEIDDALFADLGWLDAIDCSGIASGILSRFSVKNGRLIGIPLGLNGLGLVYNRGFFSKFNLSDPSRWDWDDIVENGRKVHQADSDSYLMFFPDSQWHYFFRTYILQTSGNHIFEVDGSIGCTVEDLEGVFSFILELVESGTIPPFGIGARFENGLPHTNEMWRAGKWGMATASSSTIPDIVASSPFPVSTAPYPVPADAVDKGVYAAPTMLLAISESSVHQEEAASYISFLINDSEASRIISDSCGLPVNASNRDDGGELVYSVVEAALLNSPGGLYPTETSDELLEVISEYIHMVGFGIMTPRQAALEMMRRLEQVN